MTDTALATNRAGWNHVAHHTLTTFIGEMVRAGLQLEALVETPLNVAAVKPEHEDPARWYSVARAQTMPTTLIIKARKPWP